MEYESFNICGCFKYPLISTQHISDFIRLICKSADSEMDCDCYKIAHSAFKYSDAMQERYESVTLNLSDAAKNGYALISCPFFVDKSLEAEIHFCFLDDNYYEISLMLFNEQLNEMENRDLIIDRLADLFFSKLKPIYGCCGVESFTDPLEELTPEDINSLFYKCGYVSKSVMNSFEKLLPENWMNMYSATETDTFIKIQRLNL